MHRLVLHHYVDLALPIILEEPCPIVVAAKHKEEVMNGMILDRHPCIAKTSMAGRCGMIIDQEDHLLHLEVTSGVETNMDTLVTEEEEIPMTAATDVDHDHLLARETMVDIEREARAQEHAKKMRMQNYKYPDENPAMFQMSRSF